MAHELIDSTEMYLRTVLELEEEGITSLRARLAERLNLSAPSVSEGVARLEEQGLLQLHDDRTVHLTTEGRIRATQVMRKHRLAERLLADIIGLDPAYIHEEACRWEHVISDRVESRLAEFLGQPTTSPYGNPIPGQGDPPGPAVSLADAVDGHVHLHSISESLQSDADVIRALYDHGMRAGASVELKHTPDGVVLRRDDGQEVSLPLDAARLVYVAQG